MTQMTHEKFGKLSRRDFENGAVLDEIACALADREEMLPRIQVLDALEAAGVNNWEGYEIAMENI